MLRYSLKNKIYQFNYDHQEKRELAQNAIYMEWICLATNITPADDLIGHFNSCRLFSGYSIQL